MKKFYFVGCSLTHGDDLSESERKTSSWPALISKYHNAEFVNDGVPGGSNVRTVSRVLQNINKYNRMYIQLSYINRFTFYDPKNWHEINFVQQLNHTHYRNIDYYKTFGKYYYSHWSSVLFEFKRYLEQIVLLQSVLNQNNQSYLMIPAGVIPWSKLICEEKNFVKNLSSLIDIQNFDDFNILKQYHEIQQLYKQIDLTSLMNHEPHVVTMINSEFPPGPTQHFLVAGEKKFAQLILNFEKE